MHPLKHILWFTLAGTRGGQSRAKIVHVLFVRPYNAHQLSKKLEMDYKTVQHHLGVLEKNQIITVMNKGKYGAVYFVSPLLEKEKELFDDIWSKFG